MQVRDVLTGCRVISVQGDLNRDVLGIAYDSRQVEQGFVFVAVQGLKTDGNRFVSQAIARGAAAIVSKMDAPPATGIPWVRVEDDRTALAVVAANINGRPSEKLHAVGVTGTNGKTTTTYLIESVLKAAGFPAAVFGTIEYRGPGFALSAERTTPEASDLQALFRRVVDGGWNHAVMEVSSHAIELKRVEGLRFEVAAFTNLTRDHLDFHNDMRSYFLVKKRLFTGLDGTTPRVLVLNMDDPHFDELKAIAPSRVLSYAVDGDADIRPVRYDFQDDSGSHGMSAVFKSPVGELEMRSNLLGKPNLYNIGATIGVSIGLGLKPESIRRGIGELSNVPGRFELVRAGQPFRVVVDYAHTDDALRRVLQAVRQITKGKVLVVFGCGGDRDRTKRPLMGEAAARESDLAVATSDNPRTEDPMAILREVEPGLRSGGGKPGVDYHIIADRREAIQFALRNAAAGDTVLIAGKGHETYQIVGSQVLPFDDRAVARELLNELATGRH